MAERLVRFKKFNRNNGLVGHHHRVQGRIAVFKADASQFGTPAPATLELGQKANRLKAELVALLEGIVARVKL